MERRIAAIVRWLERFLNEYRAGSLESALMDAECARADIENLRRDVWAKLELGRRRPRGRVLRGRIPSVILSVLLLLLLTASPLSTAPAPVLEPDCEGTFSVDDLRLWSASVRRGGPETALLWPEMADRPVVENVAKSVARPKGRAPRPEADDRPAAPASSRRASVEPGEKAAPYDRIFSLLQTGSRALKDEEPAIKIDRGRNEPKGEGGL